MESVVFEEFVNVVCYCLWEELEGYWLFIGNNKIKVKEEHNYYFIIFRNENVHPIFLKSFTNVNGGMWTND